MYTIVATQNGKLRFCHGHFSLGEAVKKAVKWIRKNRGAQVAVHTINDRVVWKVGND